ncbi:MAG: hypothetical protein VX498_07795 [Myxococcota bacterium]|nr:hypothetical protein [Myxococcota bacterium]
MAQHSSQPGDDQLTAFGKGVAIVSAVLILICGTMFLLEGLTVPKEVPPIAEDRLGMITAADLAPYFRGFSVNEEEEILTRKAGRLGVYELGYEYAVVSSSGGIGVIQSGQHILLSDYAATKQFDQMAVGIGISLRIGVGTGFLALERNDIFAWGDESAYALIQDDDAVIGSLLRVRHGNRIVTMTSVGVYIDDYIVADQIYGPILDRAFAYDPKTGTVPEELESTARQLP